MIRGRICGVCVRRDAIATDIDTGVPICGVCRDGIVDPPPERPLDRVLRVVHRHPGLIVQELAEILEMTTRTLSQTLCRACAQGLMRADGPRTVRRYYVDDLRPANQPRNCRLCRAELTPENWIPNGSGIQRICTSCRSTDAIDDAQIAAQRAQA